MDKLKIKNLEKENEKLKKEIKKLEDLITLDFLTQVYNRRAFNEILGKAVKEIKWGSKHKTRRRQKARFSLLVIDIDNFKKFNDKFGHLYGDKVLKKVAKFLKKYVRSFDIVARWGGEEFAVILRGTTKQQAKGKAEMLIKKTRKELPVTLSIGLSQSNPKYDKRQIFNKADKALKKAKETGKNKIVLG